MSFRIIWTDEHWTCQSVAADTERNYLFGDNLGGKGMEGQACIRGLENAFGVPTKRAPSMSPSAFFSDDSLKANTMYIDIALSVVPYDKPLVVSRKIGKGLARLDRCAPKTYAYLIEAINNLEHQESEHRTGYNPARPLPGGE